MQRIKKITWGLMLVLLAGCATPDRQTTPAPDYYTQLREHCETLGFAPGQEAARCALELHQSREQRRAIMGAAWMLRRPLHP